MAWFSSYRACLIAPTGRTRRDPDHLHNWRPLMPYWAQPALEGPMRPLDANQFRLLRLGNALREGLPTGVAARGPGMADRCVGTRSPLPCGCPRPLGTTIHAGPGLVRPATTSLPSPVRRAAPRS